MSEPTAFSGGCQCGAVRFCAHDLNDDAHICHCRMCQKAVANAFISLVSVDTDRLEWTRGAATEFFSSAKTARGFCARCGTPLYMRDTDGTKVFLTIGAFDEPDRVPPRRQVGNEGRRAWFASLHALPGNATTEEAWPEGAAAIKASNRQHPDHDTEFWPPEGRIE
ncbi:MAG: GFA family protein [Alphaproteobacteria bacterium]|nr:GFA family protein [Alphaproteobacteria bacterium]